MVGEVVRPPTVQMFISLLEDLLSLSTGANNNYTDRSAADHSTLLANFARVQWTFPSATCTCVASSNDCIYTEFLRLEKKDLSMVEVEPCRLRVDFHQCPADTLRDQVEGNHCKSCRETIIIPTNRMATENRAG